MLLVGNINGCDGGGAGLTLTASTESPTYGQSVTISASASGISPTSYTFRYPSNSTTGYASTTQAGNSLAVTAIGYGNIVVTVTATDGTIVVGSQVTLAVSQMTEVTDFFSATGISDATIQGAWRTLALRCKDNGLWAASSLIYPFIGGTASAHKYNGKDPRDLDAAYRAVFAGGWTHDANGVTGNGTNTSLNTKLNNNVLGQNSFHISLWNRTAGTSNYDASGATTPRTQFAINSASSTLFDINNSSGTGLTTPPSPLTGWWVLNRTESGYIEVWLNGVCQRRTAASSSSPGNAEIYLGCFGNGGSPILNSVRNYSFASVGAGLTPVQITTAYQDIATYHTTLGR